MFYQVDWYALEVKPFSIFRVCHVHGIYKSPKRQFVWKTKLFIVFKLSYWLHLYMSLNYVPQHSVPSGIGPLRISPVSSIKSWWGPAASFNSPSQCVTLTAPVVFPITLVPICYLLLHFSGPATGNKSDMDFTSYTQMLVRFLMLLLLISWNLLKPSILRSIASCPACTLLLSCLFSDRVLRPSEEGIDWKKKLKYTRF